MPSHSTSAPSPPRIANWLTVLPPARRRRPRSRASAGIRCSFLPSPGFGSSGSVGRSTARACPADRASAGDGRRRRRSLPGSQMIVGSLPHAAGRELGDGMSRGGSSRGLRRVAIRAAPTAVDAVGQNRRVHRLGADMAHVTFVDESRASLARRRACWNGCAVNSRAGCQRRIERFWFVWVSRHRVVSPGGCILSISP